MMAVVWIVRLRQSDDEEVRRHAVRALGSAMWNGYVEQRVLVWDVNRCATHACL